MEGIVVGRLIVLHPYCHLVHSSRSEQVWAITKMQLQLRHTVFYIEQLENRYRVMLMCFDVKTLRVHMVFFDQSPYKGFEIFAFCGTRYGDITLLQKGRQFFPLEGLVKVIEYVL